MFHVWLKPWRDPNRWFHLSLNDTNALGYHLIGASVMRRLFCVLFFVKIFQVVSVFFTLHRICTAVTTFGHFSRMLEQSQCLSNRPSFHQKSGHLSVVVSSSKSSLFRNFLEHQTLPLRQWIWWFDVILMVNVCYSESLISQHYDSFLAKVFIWHENSKIYFFQFFWLCLFWCRRRQRRRLADLVKMAFSVQCRIW